VFGSSVETAHGPGCKLTRLRVWEEQAATLYLQAFGKYPEYPDRGFEGVIELREGAEDFSHRFSEVRCLNRGALGQKLFEGFFFSASAAAGGATEPSLCAPEDVLPVDRTRL